MNQWINEIYWAAGFVEGEGSFSSAAPGKQGNSASVRVGQTQLQPLERLRALWGGSIYRMKPNIGLRRRPLWQWAISGRTAAGVAMLLYVLMSPARQVQIRVMLARWKQRALKPGLRTHCPRGHPYDFVFLVTGKRRYRGRGCRRCRAAQSRASYRRRKKEDNT